MSDPNVITPGLALESEAGERPSDNDDEKNRRLAEQDEDLDFSLQYWRVRPFEDPPPPEGNTSNYNNNDNRRRKKEEVLNSYYEKLMERFTFKTFADSREILWFDPICGVYQFNGEVKIRSELEKIFKEELESGEITIANLLTEHDRKEIIYRIKWNTITEREKFDDNDIIINVQNGLLDTRTKRLKLHTPEFLSTMQFPITYDEKARWTEVLKFFKQIQNKEGVITLLKMFGYVLMTNSNKYQKAFFFVGRGDNGKSVLIDLIETFVGKNACSSVKLHDLRNDRFMAAQMYGKVVNTYADLPGTNLSDVGLFKALVSGDMITAQHKYGKPFRFRNRAKMIFSGNQIPLSDGQDDLAYFKRWVILQFNALFKEELQDKELIKKLTTPENLSGLLNLALVGISLLQRDGFENVPIEVIREEYDRSSESLRSFIEKECTISLTKKKEYYTVKEEFNNSYLRHHKELRDSGLDYEDPLSSTQIEIELSKLNVFEKRIRANGEKRRCYMGIITKDESNKRNQAILERQKQGTLKV